MTYQSRKRNYRSRRERMQTTTRNIRLIFIFLAIALIIWAIKERHELWFWIKSYLR